MLFSRLGIRKNQYPGIIDREHAADLPSIASPGGWHSGSTCPFKSIAYTRYTPFHSVKRRY
jgi:hypothetical protein